MKLGDIELVDHTLEGDHAAFEELVLRYQDRLYNALVQTVGCANEAHDIVQEAFLSAFSKLSSFQKQASFYTWVYRIAFNAAISQKRKKRPSLSVDQYREEVGLDPVDRHEAPDAKLDREEKVQHVQNALSALHEEHRVILVLREMEGLCYDSIAEILGLPVGTVRSRLHRARGQLKETLEMMLQDVVD